MISDPDPDPEKSLPKEAIKKRNKANTTGRGER
jgi:hypothetical protein